MEVAVFYETSVYIYHTYRYHKSEHQTIIFIPTFILDPKYMFLLID
jgi:hypothetical protein